MGSNTQNSDFIEKIVPYAFGYITNTLWRTSAQVKICLLYFMRLVEHALDAGKQNVDFVETKLTGQPDFIQQPTMTNHATVDFAFILLHLLFKIHCHFFLRIIPFPSPLHSLSSFSPPRLILRHQCSEPYNCSAEPERIAQKTNITYGVYTYIGITFNFKQNC
jgi:hypothetical protein